MPKIKRLPLILLAVIQTFTLIVLPVHAQTPMLSVSAKSAVLIEAESGTVSYGKSAHTRLPMASTTKLMTALTALELMSPDTIIRAHPDAIGVEGSSIYLIANEALTLEQLLYAMLLESANDAAAAIAIGISGSIDAFAAEMNHKALSLGLKDTRFTNPHGLDHEDHYTTAYELALIARAVLKNDLLKTIVSTRKTTIPHAGTDSMRLLVNHNKLLRLYDGCIGMKTGYTQRSGRCLVSAAMRDGVTLIAVTLNASDDWNDHTRMLDYGFRQFMSHTLCKEGELTYPLPIVGGSEGVVMLSNTEALSVTLPIAPGKITRTIEGERFGYASINEGEILAHAVFRCDVDGDGVREIIGKVPLKACKSIERKIVKKGFFTWLFGLFSRK